MELNSWNFLKFQIQKNSKHSKKLNFEFCLKSPYFPSFLLSYFSFSLPVLLCMALYRSISTSLVLSLCLSPYNLSWLSKKKNLMKLDPFFPIPSATFNYPIKISFSPPTDQISSSPMNQTFPLPNQFLSLTPKIKSPLWAEFIFFPNTQWLVISCSTLKQCHLFQFLPPINQFLYLMPKTESLW